MGDFLPTLLSMCFLFEKQFLFPFFHVLDTAAAMLSGSLNRAVGK